MNTSRKFTAARSALRFDGWQRRLSGYLALARVSNSPTVVSNVLAGAALAGVLAPSGAVALLAAAMVLFYTAGMFLNDLCDEGIDKQQRPDRPLPAGVVTRSSALAVTIVMFAVGGVLLQLFGTPALLSGLALLSLIVAYDAWHKGNPLSPLLMAGCRSLVYITTFLALAKQPSDALLVAAALLGAYIVGLTYLAKCEGRSSLVGYWPAALLFLPGVVFLATGPTLWQWPLLVLFVGWVGYSCSFVYRSTGRSVGGAIGRLIAGIALGDALIAAACGSTIGAALCLVAFACTLILQRYVRGT